MKDYPNYLDTGDIEGLLRYIVKERKNDTKDFDNITNTFKSGRRVGKIPTGAATASDDRVGDYNTDATYYYEVVNVGSGAEWRRVIWTTW